jgi:hypothetical protein
MKNIFNKVFSRPILEPVLITIVSILILEYIIFPGLTIENTLLNIGSGIIGVFLTIFILNYTDGKIREKFEKKEDNDWGGLTNEELIGDDEIPNVKSKENGEI